MSPFSLSSFFTFLRILEGYPFERIGGRKPIQVNVRIVAATNRDLEEAVEDGDFRKDLYFRLQVAEIIASPLRHRRDDIEILANAFLQKFVTKTGRVIKGFTDEALQLLRDYNWPGNVRELENALERAILLTEDAYVGVADLPAELTGGVHCPEISEDLRAALRAYEREHIRQVLAATDGNREEAARRLGIDVSTLYRRLKSLGG